MKNVFLKITFIMVFCLVICIGGFKISKADEVTVTSTENTVATESNSSNEENSKDKGIGMNAEELENNLGTIAQSGSFAFKNENEKKEDVNIIGQFGVGFYSAFMVSKEVEVISKPYGLEKAYIWKSKGAEGYSIEETEKEDYGTTIILHLKDDIEDEKYTDFLGEYRIKGLVKKYSDYIRYPIKMDVEKKELKEGSKDEYETKIETETLNSMVPIWKKKKSDVTDEEYNSFYTTKFGDFEKPAKIIRSSVEGLLNYDMLLFIPQQLPYNYYTKEYEKGLELYSNGVLIMEKCKDLLPDYFSFVKGLVDSPDLSLNISREISHSFAALRVFLQFFSQIFLSFWVLELCLSPKTSITSHFLLNSSASLCRSKVVLHMLLNTRMRGYSRSITRCIAANVSESNVV